MARKELDMSQDFSSVNEELRVKVKEPLNKTLGTIVGMFFLGCFISVFLPDPANAIAAVVLIIGVIFSIAVTFKIFSNRAHTIQLKYSRRQDQE